MLDLLATATHPYHALADGDRLAILDTPSIARYRMSLARVYCFEAPFEAALVATDGLPCELLHAHLRTHVLAADLAAAGIDAREIPPARALRFDSSAEALGWMWVVHRNTLLHGQLRRELARTLPQAATTYFAIHEGRAGGVMRRLGEALDVAAHRPSIAEAIVAAAVEAFRVQRLWYTCDVLDPRRPPAPTLAPGRAA